MTDSHGSPQPVAATGRSPALPDRGIRLLRLRLAGIAKDYEVDLRAGDGAHQPLSVIAGPTNTGKTSVLRFFNYCLGGREFPDNAEVIRQVRSAVTEAAGPEGWFSLERGINAANVIVRRRRADGTEEPSVVEPHPVEPTGDPASVSQLLLATVGLQHVQLKEAPTQASSGTDPLSFRDLMWLCLFLNERIGSSQLLHEHDTNRRLKFHQVLDAVFGVHDDDGADLARRFKEAREQRDLARRDAARLAEFVREQQPQPLAELERDLEQADRDIREADAALAQLEARQSAATGFAADLRARHTAAAAAAGRARARVRDRRSLVNRFASLRAQYADDIRKLTLLTEAAEIFDQLSVTVCPACLSELEGPPAVVGGRCSLCAHELPGASETEALSLAAVGSATAADAGEEAERPQAREVGGLVKFELRSTKRRYAELNEFWQQLESELVSLELAADAADVAEAEAAAAVDRAAAGLLTPYATEREETLRRRQAAVVLRDRADRGLRLWRGVREREEAAETLARAVERLRAQIKDKHERPDRSSIIGAISSRYADILREIGYPKIDQPDEPSPFIDDRLVPHARGRSYREASSGGQVLISLAWIMAVFETAYETNAAHPGFVIIDTPQKNLGGHATEGDTEFSDSALVERFYRHIINWLAGRGTGAQVIVVDNTPPQIADPYVVVRYTRDPDRPLFGLIDNEIG